MTITPQPDRERAIETAIRAGALRSVDEFIAAAVALLNHAIRAEPAHKPTRKPRLWELRKGLPPAELSGKELSEEGRS